MRHEQVQQIICYNHPDPDPHCELPGKTTSTANKSLKVYPSYVKHFKPPKPLVYCSFTDALITRQTLLLPSSLLIYRQRHIFNHHLVIIL
jgi:hypothetical protein